MRTVLALALVLLMLGTPPGLESQPAPRQAGDRTAVDLTVYNVNMALVREERTIRLVRGMNQVVLPEIPATIDGTSLHFASLTNPQAVRVLEQNFQYDLVHHAKLLEKYIGNEVEFVRVNPATREEYTVRGRLLATGWQQQPVPQGYGGFQRSPGYTYSGQMIAEVNGKVEVTPAGHLVLPGLSEGLILKPQLQWLINATAEGEHRTEISYLAGELSWDCNYVALLNGNDTRLDLTGWVTLRNTSGTSFKNAGLKLVAGDVNLVQEEMRKARGALMTMDVAEAEPQFQQKELFEYKLYALQRRTDVNNNETKQVELTSAHQTPVSKVFVYDGLADMWRMWWGNAGYRDQKSFGQQSNPKVGVFVLFRNDEKSGLGLPLPKGKVRVYKKDDDGKEQFIGEDRIDHTPKDEEIRLYLGNAFDLVGSRVQKDFRVVVSGHVIEETIEVTVKNHKAEGVEVLVYEHPWRWSQWEIVKSDAQWEKVDQSTVKFPVKVPKDNEKKVTYTVRYSW